MDGLVFFALAYAAGVLTWPTLKGLLMQAGFFKDKE